MSRENGAATDKHDEYRHSAGEIEQNGAAGSVCRERHGGTKVEQTEDEVEDLHKDNGFDGDIETLPDSAEAVHTSQRTFAWFRIADAMLT